MKMPAVLVTPGVLADGAMVDLDEREQHHLKVRRIEADTEVLVFDGVGKVARGTLRGRNGLTVGVVQQLPFPAETVLAVGAGDRDRFLALAERCTELGVTRLVPLVTARARAVDNRFRDSALAKARQRAREACKQSENAWATDVVDGCSLAELPVRFPSVRWLLADVGGGICPAIDREDAVGWIIGPEGGLAADEFAAALERLGATPVSLGPVVLRFDTAAMAAAAITQDRRTATTG